MPATRPQPRPTGTENRTATMVFRYRDELEQIAHDRLQELAATADDPMGVLAVDAARSIAEAILRRFEVNEPRPASGGPIEFGPGAVYVVANDDRRVTPGPEVGDGACVPEAKRVGRPYLATLPSGWGTIIDVRKPTHDRTEVRIEWSPWGTTWLNADSIEWTSK